MLDTQGSSPTAVHRDARILIADDNGLARLVLADQLRALGYRCVHSAVDGREALHLALHASYDLVITDLCMPHMDGLALLAALRARGLGVPVVAGTAWCESAGALPSLTPAQEGSEHRVASPEPIPPVGFVAVLRKPFDMVQLRDLLHGVLNTRIGGVPLPERGTPAAPSPRGALRAAFAAAWVEDEPALRAALAALDPAAMLACLHRINGALGVLGETRARRACERLQQRIARHGIELRAADLERFVRLCARIASNPPH